jgi:hypothetical protein
VIRTRNDQAGGGRSQEVIYAITSLTIPGRPGLLAGWLQDHWESRTASITCAA